MAKPPLLRSLPLLGQRLRQLAADSKEAARALPDSKGGETPKYLQTYRTEVYTYFTQPSGESELLYSAENWVRIKLTLETAGPVSVGTSAQIAPVLSGKGRLLDTSQEFETYIAKGTRFYITSETVNRVSVTIEPVPWFEQISGEIIASARVVAAAVAAAAASIVAAVTALRTPSAPAVSSTGKTAAEQPVPSPQPRRMIPRLTRFVPPKKMR